MLVHNVFVLLFLPLTLSVPTVEPSPTHVERRDTLSRQQANARAWYDDPANRQLEYRKPDQDSQPSPPVPSASSRRHHVSDICLFVETEY